MGYESRVYVGHLVNMRNEKWFDEICSFNLGKIGYEFCKLFKDEIDFDVWSYDVTAENGESIAIKEDRYGYKLTYCDANTVLKYLKSVDEYDHYCRSKMLIDILESVKQFSDVVLVHYGY